MRILGISGSLRRDSHNTQLLRAAARQLPPAVELDIFDSLGTVPPYNQDHDTPRAGVAGVTRLRQAIAEADALLIATPEYNSSVPGQLKNALDWASRPIATNVLVRKQVAVIGASVGGFGAVWAQAELRKILRAIGADVLTDELALAEAHEAFNDTGALIDIGHRQALTRIMSLLIAAATQRDPPAERATAQPLASCDQAVGGRRCEPYRVGQDRRDLASHGSTQGLAPARSDALNRRTTSNQ